MSGTQGTISAGHPVDVASGVLYSDHVDLSLDGRMPLRFIRHYSTALLEKTPSALGQGWYGSLYCKLEDVDGAFEFTNESGAAIRFPGTLTDLQEPIRLLGMFMELRREANRLIVVTWNTSTFLVTRYVFAPDHDGYRFVALEGTAGQGIDLSYSPNGLLSTATQRREKRSLHFEYDAMSRLTTLQLRSGGESQLIMRYDYDESGRLAHATDSFNVAERYWYENDGRLSRVEQKDGAIWSFRFDDQGRCICATGQDNYDFKSFRYFDQTKTTQVTNSHGHTTTYSWLPTGQVWQQASPNGAKTFTKYDELGRIEEEINPVGASTSYEYGDDGNLSKMTNGLAQTTSFTYNQRRQITSVTLPNEAVIERNYDGAGRIASVRGPLGDSTFFKWSSDCDLVEVTNAAGHKRQYEYDIVGNPIQVTDANGAVDRYEYDAFGRTIRRITSLSTIEFDYDNLWRLTSVKKSDGQSTAYKYDRGGNRTSVSFSDGSFEERRFGTCGRIVELVEPDGRKVKYGWDTEPNLLLSVQNGGEATYNYAYDADGYLIREEGYDGRSMEYQRDLCGLVTSVTNGAGEGLAFQRDLLGQVLEKVTSDGTTTSFEYDELNLMISATNDAISIQFERDELGRIVREHQGDIVVDRAFDSLGLCTELSTSLGYRVQYEYDSIGAVESLTVNDDARFSFTRDLAGREVERELPGDFALATKYNGFGRITEQTVGQSPQNVGNPTEALLQRCYQYDMSGDLSQCTDSRLGTVDYTHDSGGRLTSANDSQGRRETFRYDAIGNRSQWMISASSIGEDSTLNVATNEANAITQQGETQYAYDADGRLVKKTEIDQETKVTLEWSFEWNEEGQLEAVNLPSGDRWTYGYDPLGRRVRKLGPDDDYRYVWNEHFIIQEIKNGNEVSSWVKDTESETPIATVQQGKVLSCITDQIGLPRELIDETGKIVWESTYRAWGGVEELKSENGITCNFRYPGQWFDAETGLHYNRFRYFSPELGSFISRDPIRLAGGLLEYAYAPNPLVWFDLLGLDVAGVKSGPKNETVYVVREGNRPDGKVIYVGITRQDVSARQSQHRQNDGREDWKLMPLTDAEGNELRVRHGTAKGIEQGLIDHYGIENPGPTQQLKKGQLKNDINSMSPTRDPKVREPRMEAGEPYVDKFLENEDDEKKRGQCT